MVGNIIQAAGKIYFFQENRNPGNFNQKFYYQKQHIHAQIWSTQIQINNQKTDLLKENLFEIRESIKNMLLYSLGKDAGNSMAAILLGDKKDLDQTIKQLYQKGGIGHILAISGLHMSFPSDHQRASPAQSHPSSLNQKMRTFQLPEVS